jgi:hypothetical protein
MFKSRFVRPANARETHMVRAADQMRSRGFDAAGASGLAFLQSQLELIDTDLVEPLSAVTHARDITVEVGGGFPEFVSEFAANYGSPGTKFFGLQGTRNTEIAEVTADIQKMVVKVIDWAASMKISYLDLQRMEFAKRTGQSPPFSLQALYEKSCQTLWNKALDYVTYFGFDGQPGLINNPNAPETVVPNGAGGHPSWYTKTSAEILNDVNYLLNAAMANSGYDAPEGMPDRMLVPYPYFALLTQPMALGGIGTAQSTLEWIEKNCVAAHHGVQFKIHFLPNDWISGQGAAGSDRAVVYRNNKESLLLRVPTAMQQGMTIPVLEGVGAYATTFVGCMTPVIFKRTTTMIYGDGLGTT